MIPSYVKMRQIEQANILKDRAAEKPVMIKCGSEGMLKAGPPATKMRQTKLDEHFKPVKNTGSH